MISPERLSILSCPKCYSRLGLEKLPSSDDLIRCPECGEEYPYIGGVLGLFYVDDTWFWPVHEMVALHEMAMKAKAGELEPDRVSRNTVDVHAVMTVATEMSNKAISSFPQAGGQPLLEVGSGSCTQAKELSDRGFDVIAVDLNPMELLHPRPRYIDRMGHEFHAEYFDYSDDFPPEEIGFLRIAADIHNLPVLDQSFELCHSRTMLHHLNPLSPALAEMGRVLSRGGVWQASAEPALSLLDWDPPMATDGSSIDYQEGIHECSPSFREYLKGFRAGNLDLEQYEVWYARNRINLGLRNRERFRLRWTGPEKASGHSIKVSKLRAMWMTTVGNFTLRRKPFGDTHGERPSRDRERRANPEWFFHPDRYGSEIRDALRKLVPLSALDEPAHLSSLREPEIQVRGFRLTERVGDRPVRFATRRASIYLPPPGGCERIYLDLFNPLGEGDSLQLTLSVDDIDAGTVRCDQPGFFRSYVDLPDTLGNRPHAIEIKLETDRLVLHPDERYLGIAVERVGYCRD